MFKTYQIKWYFILTGILTSVTSISLGLRHEGFKSVKWWEYPQYAFQVSLTLFACWMVHGFFLVHRFSWLKNYPKHFLSNFTATLVTFFLAYSLYALLPNSLLNDNGVTYESLSDVIVHLMSAFLASIVSYVLFYSIYTNAELQNSKLENELLEQAHLRAQLLSLQQQISPHFLFNSLSTLKTIASDQPTKNYVVQLAAVYRYVLNFNEHYLTPLKEELAFIKSYLYIMKERFEASLLVIIHIPEEHLEFMIPPLSLQLLIENAIKHNMISPERPLQITILTNDSPELIVTNNLQLKKVPEESTGTGLKNITERYKLLMHKPVQITNDGNYFAVTLPLLKK
ncbi:histidine kinase [Mucilaginibacter sp. SMC90]|uniref:sensor histidine kinase n=1 Tax=Mucilaginibacter sp. SMC90 TaxID=2929803 RepID=UPI001FB4865E|nr:histidine kinase [Mucilaginibacter sp. SMC90]UOE49809.1 histidine kinase [Mucilaginibacter sp. SMC90]